MGIVVYWACLENQWMRAKEPESVSKMFYSLNIHDQNDTNVSLNYCPAFNNNIKNLYAIRSLYQYSFTVQNGSVNSTLHNQEFFDNHIHIRSVEKKFFTFNNRYIFFTEENSLPMTAYEFPFLEQNEISKRCIPIPGQYDIGKWFRPLEFPFLLKSDFNEFKVDYNDVLYYTRFHTDKKIQFKQFLITDNIKSYYMASINSSFFKLKKYNSMNDFYNIFKHKKLILKEIKNNLID